MIGGGFDQLLGQFHFVAAVAVKRTSNQQMAGQLHLADHAHLRKTGVAMLVAGAVIARPIFRRVGRAPDNAIDGLVTTSQSSRWLSDYSDPPHWLQLDFSAPQTVRQGKLYFFDPEGDTIYLSRGLEVQVQQDGKWRTVAAVTDNAQLRPTLNFAPVTTRALRVVFTTGCASDNMIRLREVEVH